MAYWGNVINVNAVLKSQEKEQRKQEGEIDQKKKKSNSQRKCKRSLHL